MILSRSLGTHSGTFHADEVTACAFFLLLKLVDIDKIFRTRDPEILAKCQYVCDVGGVYDPSQNKFDHHQSTYRGELSSAGMVLLEFKSQHLISDELYHYLNKSLVWGVDAHDNGRGDSDIGVCTFSNVISNFVPVAYNASSQEQDAAFFEAVSFTLGHLQRLIDRFHFVQQCKQKVIDAMATSSKYLYFEEAIPWMDAFFENGGEAHQALFVIMPSGDQWKLRGIPPLSSDRMKVRLPLPSEWAGLLDDELKKASGISGAIFCHKGRFISVWRTKEDAFAALKTIFEREGI